MNFIVMLYRKTDGRYWWLLAMFTLLGGIIGIMPILLTLSLNPSFRLAGNPDVLLGIIVMGWRFGFLPSILTWAILFILGLKRGLSGSIITVFTGALTSMLNGWLLFELNFAQGILAGMCGALAAFILSLFLPKPKRRDEED